MITSSQFPPYIDMGRPTALDPVTRGNDAILAIRYPKAFLIKTFYILDYKLRVLKYWKGGTDSNLPPEIIDLITGYLGPQETNRLNLQSFQELRIGHIEALAGYKITPALANYDADARKTIIAREAQAIVEKAIVEEAIEEAVGQLVSKLDAVATLMLLTENAVNLLPQEVKKSVSEYVDIKHMQYGTEMMLGLGASYIAYQLGAITSWTLPLQRASMFCGKGIIIDTLSTNMKTVTGTIDDYTYGYIGDKEQSLILEIAFGVGIGILSPAPMMTIGLASLGGIRNYLDIEEQNIGKIGGGLLGFAGAYYAGVETSYQYAASIISSAYVGDMLVGAKEIAEHGIDFMFNVEETPIVDTCGDTPQDSPSH